MNSKVNAVSVNAYHDYAFIPTLVQGQDKRVTLYVKVDASVAFVFCPRCEAPVGKRCVADTSPTRTKNSVCQVRRMLFDRLRPRLASLTPAKVEPVAV